MTTRWKLETLDAAESYTFEINPNAQDSPFLVRNVTWDYNGPVLGWSGRRDGRLPKDWSFSGVLRSQAQYDALLVWVGKRVKIKLTDDRGTVYTLRLTTFSPSQQGPARRNAPWRMTYTMRAMVYDVEPPT